MDRLTNDMHKRPSDLAQLEPVAICFFEKSEEVSVPKAQQQENAEDTNKLRAFCV